VATLQLWCVSHISNQIEGAVKVVAVATEQTCERIAACERLLEKVDGYTSRRLSEMKRLEEANRETYGYDINR